jgi:hypothetical protein
MHWYDGRDVSAEHSRPFAFFDMLAMVGTRRSFGGPFLLEKGHAMLSDVESIEVVQIVLVPGLADFLGARKKGYQLVCSSGALEQRSQLVLTICFRPWNRFRAIVVLEWELMPA